MEKSVLEMVGGEKHINPHYDIKAESTSCYPVGKGFTGIEMNGVRFSNIGEMLRYMDRQRDQLTKAKELLKEFVQHYKAKTIYVENMQDLLEQSEQFISEVEK